MLKRSDLFKGSAAPPDCQENNPPPELVLDQQQDAREPPEALPFERPWDRPTLAEYLGVTVSGLDKLIKGGRAPPYFKAGRMLRWRPSAVRAWTLAQEERATAIDAGTVTIARRKSRAEADPR
jgi:predicted DNA-binding transcriptional regulator AlpA